MEQLRPPQQAARPLRELLVSGRASILAQDDGPHSDSDIEIAGVVLANLDAQHLAKVTAMAEHVSEILTGYKSGSLEVAENDGPRPQYLP